MNRILFLLMLTVNLCVAQQTPDEQLAAQYFQNKEFDKAVVYYEKLFDKKPIQLYYDYYLVCLIELKEFKKAEKLVKKQIKNNPDLLSYLVDLGKIYRAEDDPKSASAQFETAISKLKENQQQIFDLANAFISIAEYDLAIDVFKKGRKLVKEYPFNFEIASIYNMKGDYNAMVVELLDVLIINNGYLESVQAQLQLGSGENTDVAKNETVKSELLRRIQKYPEKQVYSELLIWMLMQQREFDAAFVQAKALDKRNKEDGYRVMNLAQVCTQNEAFDVSILCYEYIIGKQKENYYYLNAKLELLDVRFKKVVSKNDYTKNDLLELEKLYETTLSELGRSSATVLLMKSLAHLHAFYLHDTEKALLLMNEAMGLTGISPVNIAECKLEQADILLLSGDVWEASLLYSQVEKSYKHDVIGQYAKYKNAKLSYFIGDFSWAKSQLEVLRGATTKLIANDAMDLFLLITDNLAVDTNPQPLKLFARADLLEFQNKDSLSLITLDSIETIYSFHALSDEVLYKKYQIAYKNKKYEAAASLLEKIIAEYDFDLLGDDACYQLALLYENKLNKKDDAKKTYEKLLLNHPDSLFTVDARKRYRRLRGDAVN